MLLQLLQFLAVVVMCVLVCREWRALGRTREYDGEVLSNERLAPRPLTTRRIKLRIALRGKGTPRLQNDTVTNGNGDE